MKRTVLNGVALVVVAAMVCSAGCVTVPAGSPKELAKPSKLFSWQMPWNKKKDEAPAPYPKPVKMATTWSPDTLVQTGRTPTRGFGGRIFFYDEKSRAVPVEGTLIVHAFDENSPNPQANAKRYEFTSEQLTRHFSQTDLGASYSVWIPWDAVGGESKRISLVASFKPVEPKGSILSANGKTREEVKLVQGLPAMVMLPGVDSELNKIAKSENRMSPEYQDYKAALASIDTKPSGLTTTTIQRRRGHHRSSDPIPSMKMPRSLLPRGVNELGTQIAEGSSTPSLEIKMAGRNAGQSNVLPASATMPLQ
ncbi:hypothetical protein CA13_12800 [Planctomycetes bacterium CA13]|uniref:Uncharacterized protein n=1 Tax=Novipirellula herctigrandis TaxID=2527986 RepID=A0A5C5YZL4_9BACT|nr:hypothetical protein CA13_12800 [Planctomycetes bacterium CA13]